MEREESFFAFYVKQNSLLPATDIVYANDPMIFNSIEVDHFMDIE